MGVDESTILIICYLVFSTVGLKLFSRGLQGLLSRVHRYAINLMSGRYWNGWLAGLISQLVGGMPLVHLLYNGGFVSSGIFQPKQARGYQASMLFSLVLIAIAAYSSIYVPWQAILLVGGLLWLQFLLPQLRLVGLTMAGFGLFAWGNQLFLSALNRWMSSVQEVTIFHYLADNQFGDMVVLLAGSMAVAICLPASHILLIAATAAAFSSMVSLENFLFIVAGQAIGESLVVVWTFRKSQQAVRQLVTELPINLILAFTLTNLLLWQFHVGDVVEAIGLTLVLFWGLHSLISWSPVSSWLTSGLYPGPKSKEMQKLAFHHPLLRRMPALGVEHIQSEIRKMAAMVQTILDLTDSTLIKADVDSREKILKYETITDKIQNEVRDYAASLMHAPLNPTDAKSLRRLIRVTENLESIADHCRAIIRFMKTDLSDDERQALRRHFGQLYELYQTVFPDLTQVDFLNIETHHAREEIHRIKVEMDENRSLFSETYPNLVDIYIRFRLIVSRLENISEAK